jgi:fructosamine-3-kinase
VTGGDIARSFAARAADGTRVFVKTLPDAPPGFFEAEALGLDRLRVAAGPPVPEVLAAGPDGLVLEWIEPAGPSAVAAHAFGQRLARLHQAGGERFGAAAPGFVATVRLDNSETADWPAFQAERRLLPALAAARACHGVDKADAATIETVISRLPALAGPAEAPARVHGDLWAGNLVWAADGQVWLVDAAASHDGHRETDLAMLALFGAPYLADIIAAYDQTYPLAAGWQLRVALHQIHPLLVHAALFGGGYGARAGSAATLVLSA